MAPVSRKGKKGQSAQPAFSETALSKSIAKLDKTLAKPNGSVNGGKRKRHEGPAEAPQSKKRQTDTSEASHAKDSPSAKRAAKKPAGPSPDRLLDEIRALGGDEKDLELVANLDSDAEEDEGEFQAFGAGKVLDNSLQNELAKFASSLGFESLPNDDAETVVSDEEEQDGDGEGAQEHGEVEEEGAQDGDDSAPEPEDYEQETSPNPPKMESRRGKKLGKLTFEPLPDWSSVSTRHLPSPASDDTRQYSSAIAAMKAYAQRLLEEDASVYSANQSSSSNQKFMSTIMSSGTLSDRVSALTLAIQESPVHNVKAFESLIGLAGKKSRGQAIAALGALVDLLGNGVVLPSDRRLRTFQSQPGLVGTLQRTSTRAWAVGQRLPGKMTKAHLIMWAYENWLKEAYFRIIQTLEVWCGDEVVYSRSRALDFVFGLLKSKPEQEANLLRLLVNKLGDRERKIASRASYLLLQLFNVHPGMKAVVVKTVEQEVILRPGQNVRAKYFAINTLNQTVLSTKEPAIADTLIRIYFEMFLSLLKAGSLGVLDSLHSEKNPKDGSRSKGKKHKPAASASGNEDETSQKLVSAVLTGVNRAIPFATADNSTLEKHLGTLFRITHSSNFNTSVQALMLIQQLALNKQLAVDRFYRTLYESLLDPRLVTSSKQALYLNLLYRSLKNDVDVRRVKAFVKRMLQVINLHQPPFACGILFLVIELEGAFPDMKALLNNPEEYDSDEEEVYRDVDEDDAQARASPAGGAGSTKTRRPTYDGRKRDPEYSNADKSCLWEIVPFLSHYHPSVSVFAASLLARQKGLPKPDLSHHTLIHFLDKFVFKAPKATETQRGSSIMQPVLASSSASIVAAPAKAGAKQPVSVNSASFWSLKPDQVAAEDVFFHQYFAQIGKSGQAARAAKRAAGAAAGEEEEEDQAEDEIWEAMVNSRPEIGGDEEGDSDVDMAGFDDDDDVSLDLGSDAGDMDEDIPSGDDDGFEGIFGDSDESGDDEEEEEEEEEKEEEVAAPAKDRGKGKGRLNRKEMKSLPTFASADDYAAMLAAEDDLDG